MDLAFCTAYRTAPAVTVGHYKNGRVVCGLGVGARIEEGEERNAVAA